MTSKSPVDDPPLKWVLFENPGPAAPLNHLDAELACTDDVTQGTCRAGGSAAAVPCRGTPSAAGEA
jgi:hypothetical protein